MKAVATKGCRTQYRVEGSKDNKKILLIHSTSISIAPAIGQQP